MLVTLILWLGLAASGAPGSPDVYHIEVLRGPGLYDAPHLTPLPDTLPLAELRDGGVWLPLTLNTALGAYRRACDELPVTFQAQLRQLEIVEAMSLAHGLELGAARERWRSSRLALDAPPIVEAGLPSWIRTALITLAIGAAAVGGFAIGWLARGAAS